MSAHELKFETWERIVRLEERLRTNHYGKSGKKFALNQLMKAKERFRTLTPYEPPK
jgi:hypothetical protein